jgi:hypothetical protein
MPVVVVVEPHDLALRRGTARVRSRKAAGAGVVRTSGSLLSSGSSSFEEGGDLPSIADTPDDGAERRTRPRGEEGAASDSAATAFASDTDIAAGGGDWRTGEATHQAAEEGGGGAAAAAAVLSFGAVSSVAGSPFDPGYARRLERRRRGRFEDGERTLFGRSDDKDGDGEGDDDGDHDDDDGVSASSEEAAEQERRLWLLMLCWPFGVIAVVIVITSVRKRNKDIVSQRKKGTKDEDHHADLDIIMHDA